MYSPDTLVSPKNMASEKSQRQTPLINLINPFAILFEFNLCVHGYCLTSGRCKMGSS